MNFFESRNGYECVERITKALEDIASNLKENNEKLDKLLSLRENSPKTQVSDFSERFPKNEN